MPITLSRLRLGQNGSRHMNRLVEEVELALNGEYPDTFLIAAVTGLQDELDGIADSFTAVNDALALKLPKETAAFTVATVPDATEHIGRVILVTDGGAGEPCLAVSNGTHWKVVALLTDNISAGE